MTERVNMCKWGWSAAHMVHIPTANDCFGCCALLAEVFFSPLMFCLQGLSLLSGFLNKGKWVHCFVKSDWKELGGAEHEARPGLAFMWENTGFMSVVKRQRRVKHRAAVKDRFSH